MSLWKSLRFIYLLAVVVAVISGNGEGYGQGARGVVIGRVVDSGGRAVGAAAVILRRGAAGFERRAQADGEGRFEFTELGAGVYELTASSQGFAFAMREVTVRAGESLEIEVGLRPGAVTEQVVIVSGSIAGFPEAKTRIPGSVETIDRETLETSRVFNVNEALRKVAGITVRDEEGFGLRPNIGIRGLNPTRSTKVLLLEDGLPLTFAPYGDNASYYHPPIERFESVEILKGSGQIQYGPVTVGGVINYITPAPPAKQSGSVTLIGGNRNYFNGRLNYGGTFGRTGFVFDYLRKQGDGARENIRSGLNDFTLKSITTLGSRQAVTVKANYFGEDSNVTYSGLRQAEYDLNPRSNPFRNDFFYGDRFGGAISHSLAINPNLLLTTNLYGMSFHRRWWRQSSNSSQRPNDAADPVCGGMANLNTTCGNEGRLRKYTNWGLEPRLKATWRLAGIRNETDLGFRIHFEHQDRRQENGDFPNSRGGRLVENNIRNNDAYSGFIQNRFQMGNLTITPGLRIERIRFERINQLVPVSGRTAITQVIPGIGASYSPTERVTLFAGVHRGFAPPRTEDIINNTTGGSIDLDPERSWNYEIGLRSLLRQGVRLEATFFRMDYENQIIAASLAGGAGATLTNGGETLHQGAELSSRVDFGTILDSPHNFYVRVAYTYLPVSKFTGIRFSNVSGSGNISVSGNRLPYASEHMANATVGYSHPRGFEAFIEAVYTGHQFGDDLNSVQGTADGQRGLLPAYTLLNATANYSVERIRTTFFFTVKNLDDRTAIVDRTRGILPTSPRLAQAGLKFRF